MSTISADRSEGIGVITFRRPERLNAFSDEMVRDVRSAIEDMDADEDTRVIVLHGAGRAFSSGADVHQRQLRTESEFKKLGGPEGRDARGEDLVHGLKNWKPMIAAVHGYVLGMAVGVALDCEIVIADESTRFQVTEVRRGLQAARYNQLLRRRGTGSFADEVCVTGRFFDASEALHHGVINEVVADGQRLERAMEIARQIAAMPPLGIRTVVRTRRYEIQQANQLVSLFVDPMQLHLTEDFQESARAFAERREPRPFVGR